MIRVPMLICYAKGEPPVWRGRRMRNKEKLCTRISCDPSSKQASGIEQKISHLRRFLSVLPERAREPHVTAAAFCGDQCRLCSAHRRHRDSEMVVGRGGAGPRVRVRVGGTFFFRAQQARDISLSRLQLDGRLAVVVGYFDRQTKVLNLCPGNAIRAI